VNNWLENNTEQNNLIKSNDIILIGRKYHIDFEDVDCHHKDGIFAMFSGMKK